MPKELRWILAVALFAFLAFEVWGFVQIQERQSQRRQMEDRVASARRTKPKPTALEGLLRQGNAFGHATEARVLACEYGRIPEDDKEQVWDYLCHLYWGTQPGLKESVHQMKFGVMADSSGITRLSDLVPEKGPAPLLAEARR
jgi:hypothetical protein